MNRALTAATVYFLTLFALGFLLGSIRVLFVAPQIGVLGATLLEVPLMLAAASFLFETLVGVALFGRTLGETWAGLATPAGLVGLTAQVIAALLPMLIGRRR
jgi:hypothetical protein